MRYLSLFSGIEAASVAWHPLGWECAGVAEVEKFPSAVLAHHFQNVPNLGDVTKYKEWPDAKFDVLVGGSPCQSFSVAGLRKGLADPRGNLMLTYLAIAGRYRPKWIVWENVPGVLSIDGGRAFGSFLGGLAELRYGFAYRVLDAQHFGVPQRRRRVFVVGYLGDWRRAAAVLFERESLSGDPAPRREARKDVAGSLSARTRGGGGLGTDFEVLTFGWNKSAAQTLRVDSEVAEALQSSSSSSNPAIAFSSKDSGSDAGSIAPTLRSMGHDGSHANGGGQVAVASAMQVRRITPREAERLQGFPDDFTAIPYGSGVRPEKLDANYIKYCQRGNPKKMTRAEVAARAADGPRYKALGNSMAVPVMSWIGRRISEVEE